MGIYDNACVTCDINDTHAVLKREPEVQST